VQLPPLASRVEKATCGEGNFLEAVATLITHTMFRRITTGDFFWSKPFFCPGPDAGVSACIARQGHAALKVLRSARKSVGVLSGWAVRTATARLIPKRCASDQSTANKADAKVTPSLLYLDDLAIPRRDAGSVVHAGHVHHLPAGGACRHAAPARRLQIQRVVRRQVVQRQVVQRLVRLQVLILDEQLGQGERRRRSWRHEQDVLGQWQERRQVDVWRVNNKGREHAVQRLWRQSVLVAPPILRLRGAHKFGLDQ
jgi:hypothetical protein